MQMLNKVLIVGRLTRDPDMRRTQAGITVASFTLAVDRDYKDKASGERGTDFINVVAWRQAGEFVGKYFSKGRMAVVEGRLQVRDWTDQDGKKRWTTEVVADNVYFGDSKYNKPGEAAEGNAPESSLPEHRPPEYTEYPEDKEKLPF